VSKKSDDQYDDKETKQRFDAMLKGAMKSPPKLMKEIPTTKQKREAAKTKPGKSPARKPGGR
jgi:hypothetical protein